MLENYSLIRLNLKGGGRISLSNKLPLSSTKSQASFLGEG